MGATRASSDLHFAREQESDRGDREHNADDSERVAEAHDQGLAFDNIAERHDRLMLGGGGIGDAV